MAIVDRTQEKIELAYELGMRDWARAQESIKKEITYITSMQFKEVTVDEIESRLNKLTFFKDFPADTFRGNVFCFFFIAGICILIAVPILFFGKELSGATHSLIASVVSIGISGLFLLLNGINRCTTKSMDIEDWKDNIPYGGMLAMKEAKDKGIECFKIFYPVLDKERFKSDPIIVGELSSGKMVEIFFWDDGKVYE